LDSKVLLGIIAVTIVGSFAVSGLFVQAGLEDLEILIVIDPTPANAESGFDPVTSTATCPITHKVIGGGIDSIIPTRPLSMNLISIRESIDLITNSYSVSIDTTNPFPGVDVRAFATCAKINFPMMGMIGGVLLDIDTTSLLVASIGTNPVITGLFAVTVAGVIGQAVWFVHRRKKSENS